MRTMKHVIYTTYRL